VTGLAAAIAVTTAGLLAPAANAATTGIPSPVGGVPSPTGVTGLPAPGTTVSLAESAGLNLVCKGINVTIDLKGTLKILIGKVTTPSLGSPVLAVTTEADALTGTSAKFGNVTVALTAPAAGSITEQSLTTPFPANVALALPLKITVGTNPCVSAGARGADTAPLVLTTKNPAQLIGKLTQFPPKGDLYQLQNPVDLINMENPDTVVATIQKFPVKVGGL
jgi:hypothetical protein